MRWKPFERVGPRGPCAGEWRIKRTFLFFPVTLPSVSMYGEDGNDVQYERPVETRWLEWAEIVQWWLISSDGSHWVSDSWVDELAKKHYIKQESWRKIPDGLWYGTKEKSKPTPKWAEGT